MEMGFSAVAGSGNKQYRKSPERKTEPDLPSKIELRYLLDFYYMAI